jgi:hypothetical protein
VPLMNSLRAAHAPTPYRIGDDARSCSLREINYRAGEGRLNSGQPNGSVVMQPGTSSGSLAAMR